MGRDGYGRSYIFQNGGELGRALVERDKGLQVEQREQQYDKAKAPKRQNVDILLQVAKLTY